MKIDIIVVNSPSGVNASARAAQSVYLRGEDWIFICANCSTWEVFDAQKSESLICWCCSEPYEKYVASSRNYS